MLSQLQFTYQRIEQSLQRLTDSIAAYNPSVTAGDELVAADEALTQDLEKLIEHQRNVLRISELKRIAQDNDERIKAHFRALALVRKELCSVPSSESTTVTNTNRDVSVDELLAYARFISPTTVPPTLRRQDVATPTTVKKEGEAESDIHMSNGVDTAAVSHEDVKQQPAPPSSQPPAAERFMTEADKTFLNPLQNLPFEPWPSHGVIASGALAQIQRMVEQGVDPGSVLSAEEQVEVERRRREEEERERMEEEERLRRRRRSMFDANRTVVQSDVFDPDA